MGIVCQIGGADVFASRVGGGNFAVSAAGVHAAVRPPSVALSHVRMNEALGLNAAFRSWSYNGRYGETAGAEATAPLCGHQALDRSGSCLTSLTGRMSANRGPSGQIVSRGMVGMGASLSLPDARRRSLHRTHSRRMLTAAVIAPSSQPVLVEFRGPRVRLLRVFRFSRVFP